MRHRRSTEPVEESVRPDRRPLHQVHWVLIGHRLTAIGRNEVTGGSGRHGTALQSIVRAQAILRVCPEKSQKDDSRVPGAHDPYEQSPPPFTLLHILVLVPCGAAVSSTLCFSYPTSLHPSQLHFSPPRMMSDSTTHVHRSLACERSHDRALIHLFTHLPSP